MSDSRLYDIGDSMDILGLARAIYGRAAAQVVFDPETAATVWRGLAERAFTAAEVFYGVANEAAVVVDPDGDDPEEIPYTGPCPFKAGDVVALRDEPIPHKVAFLVQGVYTVHQQVVAKLTTGESPAFFSPIDELVPFGSPPVVENRLTIRAGDMVLHKSMFGIEPMKVDEVLPDNRVRASWVDREGHPRSWVFSLENLILQTGG